MEAPACTPPVPFDDVDTDQAADLDTDVTFEIDADLPHEVIDAYAVVAEANLSPDHAFLLGYALLGQYLAHHVEQVTDLTDELMSPDMHAELTEQERFDRLGWLAVWSADQGRLEGALDLLLPVVQGANDSDDSEGDEGDEDPAVIHADGI